MEGGATYFFHNTLHFESDYSGAGTLYRGGLFDVDGASATTDVSRVVSANNVIEFGGSTYKGQMRYSGQLEWEAANLVFSSPSGVFAESDSYTNSQNAGDDPAVTIVNNDTRITTSANFVDETNADVLLRDYSLDTGSPAIGAAVSLPAALSTFPVEYNAVDINTGVMAARATTNDLGAIE